MILDEIMKLANKFIPDKGSQNDFMLEMYKLDLQEVKEKKDLLEKIVPMTFPLLVYVMVFGLISNILAGWISLIFKVETPIYQIESYHYELIKVFCIALFSKKTIEKFTPKEK